MGMTPGDCRHSRLLERLGIDRARAGRVRTLFGEGFVLDDLQTIPASWTTLFTPPRQRLGCADVTSRIATVARLRFARSFVVSGPEHLWRCQAQSVRRLASKWSCGYMIALGAKRILILGGGFGGLYTAMELEKGLAEDSSVEVTLVNRENFFLFTPMLHEIAASDLDFTHIVNPIRRLLKKVEFFHGEVQAIDLQSRSVRLVHGPQRHPHEIDYDYLVIALGSTTNYYGISGLQDKAVAMKSLGDAIHLRNQLIDFLEEADFECAVGSRNELLTVMVAGGGFSGVETVAAVNDFLRGALRSYPHLTGNLIRVVLVHPGEVILPELGPNWACMRKKSWQGGEWKFGSKPRSSGYQREASSLTMEPRSRRRP